MNKILFFTLFLFAAGVHNANSQENPITVIHPKYVCVTETFKVSYQIEGEGKVLTFHETDNFELVAPLSESISNSWQQIGDSISRKLTETKFTYTLKAKKTGSFLLPAPVILIDGVKHTSPKTYIPVTKADCSKPETDYDWKKKHVNDENTRIEFTLSKTTAYKMEPILAEWKITTDLALSSITDQNVLAFDGFVYYDITNDSSRYKQIEKDGKVLNSVIMTKKLLYPTKTGKIRVNGQN